MFLEGSLAAELGDRRLGLEAAPARHITLLAARPSPHTGHVVMFERELETVDPSQPASSLAVIL